MQQRPYYGTVCEWSLLSQVKKYETYQDTYQGI